MRVRFSSVRLRSPRSMRPRCDRSRPELSASVSCDISNACRRARIAIPTRTSCCSVSVFPETRFTERRLPPRLDTATAFTAHFALASLQGATGLKRETSLPGTVTAALTAAVLLALLSACAAPAARSACANEGFAVGSEAHVACANNLRHRWKTEARNDLAEGLLLGAAVAGATAVTQYGVTSRQPLALTSTASLQRAWWGSSGRMCSYANGTTLNVGAGSCPSSVVAPR